MSDVFDEIEKAKRECLKCKHKNSPCMNGRMLRIEGFENE